MQNVELKIKPLVHAFETTVSQYYRAGQSFLAGKRNGKWREGRVARDNIEMAWTPVENPSRGQRGMRASIRDCKPLVRFMEKNWRFEKSKVKWIHLSQVLRKCILSLWGYLLCVCTSFVHSVQHFKSYSVLNRGLFIFIFKHSFSEVMGETKEKKIGTLCCHGLKPPVVRGYAAAFSYWFRTFWHTEQYSKAIITAEDGSQRVLPKGNPMSSPGKL